MGSSTFACRSLQLNEIFFLELAVVKVALKLVARTTRLPCLPLI